MDPELALVLDFQNCMFCDVQWAGCSPWKRCIGAENAFLHHADVGWPEVRSIVLTERSKQKSICLLISWLVRQIGPNLVFVSRSHWADETLSVWVGEELDKWIWRKGVQQLPLTGRDGGSTAQSGLSGSEISIQPPSVPAGLYNLLSEMNEEQRWREAQLPFFLLLPLPIRRLPLWFITCQTLNKISDTFQPW